VLTDIRSLAERLNEDEGKLIEKIAEINGKGKNREAYETKTKLNEAKKRLVIVEGMAQKLFEERCTGNVPDSIFRKLMTGYDIEQANLGQKISELQSSLLKIEHSSLDVTSWAEDFRKYTGIERLDRTIVTKLIDTIEIHETVKENKIRSQEISIRYKFIGKLSA
jgi:site-specific DNA recombinase